VTFSVQLVQIARAAVLALCMALACHVDSCFAAAETAGAGARDELVDRVAAARKSLDDARNAYFNALQQLRAIATFDGTNLAPMSGRLRSRLGEAEARARDFGGRVDAIDSAADALLHGWSDRHAQRTASPHAVSKKQLERARALHANLSSVLRHTRADLSTALAELSEKASHLERNHQAATIDTIKRDMPAIQNGADRLHRDAEQANAAAERFVREFPAQP
jgi:hypothetical protein